MNVSVELLRTAEHRRINAFELWCWKRPFRVPWTLRTAVHPKGSKSWLFTGRTDAEAEAPILWPPDMKNWLLREDLYAGKDWRQKEKGMAEDEMVGWHHWLGHESDQAPGVGDGQGSLACCSPWGCKELDTTEWTELNWTDSLEGLTQMSSVLWPPDAKSRLIGKDPYARKDWGQEKRATENEMVGWHHQLNAHEFEQTPGDSEGQASLCATVHGVAKSWTWLSNWITTIYHLSLDLCPSSESS